MTQTVIAVFDSTAEAEQAAHHLALDVSGVRGEVYGAARPRDLGTLSIPAEDVATMSEAIRRGGAIVYAQVPDGRYDDVVRILEADGAVDINEREAAWRSEGWGGGIATGQTIQAAGVTGTRASDTAVGSARQIGTGVIGQPGMEASSETSIGANQTGQTHDVTGRTTVKATGQTESIPIVEERLLVSRRDTAGGTVRVRSYVVETPVQEQVTLHEEHVHIERRPVDRPVGAADDALFRDRVIEAVETSEEAVISKEARVKEEVVISKTAEERTETVSDTVRKTEVEVKDERSRTDPPQRPDRY